MVGLTVTIITKNEEHNILRCLASVKPVATEIVVVDSHSSDRTAEICRSFGCRVFERAFDGYGTQKQFAVDQAVNNWVLSVDADEVVSEELRHELQELLSQKSDHSEPANTSISAYRIPFSLHFMGRIMKYSGVGHEFHLRLFDRRCGGFTQAAVHEGIEIKGNTGTLRGRMIHYSYRSISHHLGKINIYTSQAAEGYRNKGRSFPKLWVSLKFPASFFSFYILKLGFLDGYPGFMWSFLAAVYATLKVAKTIESAQKP